MHIVVLNHILKKVVNKLSFNLISFKMQLQTFTVTTTFSERWSPIFNSLVVLNFFHPFPMLIMGDPLIFFPLATHTFMCLNSSMCLPRIVTFVPILPLCFIMNLWDNQTYEKLEIVQGRSMWHFEASISVRIIYQ